VQAVFSLEREIFSPFLKKVIPFLFPPPPKNTVPPFLAKKVFFFFFPDDLRNSFYSVAPFFFVQLDARPFFPFSREFGWAAFF